MPITKKWTFMVYNNYDDPHIGIIHRNIAAELMNVGSTDEVNLVALCDEPPPPHGGPDTLGTPLYLIPRRTEPQVLACHPDWPGDELDMAHPATLVTFAAFVKEHFPAERYALVIASHGYGWTQGTVTWRSSQGTRNLRRLLAFSRSSGSRDHLLDNIANRRRADRRAPVEDTGGIYRSTALSPDMTSQTELSSANLALAAQSIAQALGRPLDLLGFDACMMQMTEIAFQLAGSVRYQVGPEWFGHAWPYTDICTGLVNAPDQPPDALARAVVECYRAHRESTYTPRYSLSAADLGQLDELALRIDDFVAAFLAQPLPPDQLDAVVKATQLVSTKYLYRDLGDFARRLAAMPVSPQLRQAGEALHEHLTERLVIAHCAQSPPAPPDLQVSTERHLKHTTGLSISLPLFCAPTDANALAYRCLQLSTETAWDDLLFSAQGPKP